MSKVGAAVLKRTGPVGSALVEPIGVGSEVTGAIRAMDFFRNQTGAIVLPAAVSGEGAHRFHVGDTTLTYQGPVPLQASAPVWDLVHLPHSAGWPEAPDCAPR